MKGEELLKEYCQKTYQKQLVKVNERVYFFYSYGHSNATAIIGDTSVILVDTLDTDECAMDLKSDLAKITDKPVKTIIFTHSHPDHRGGVGAFQETVEEIIAFSPVKESLKYYDKINDFLMQRGHYQHGYGLTDEEAICQGIGIREGKEINHGKYAFLQPTTVYDNDVSRTIDGVKLQLVRAPGETDDQILIWLEDDQVICTGDNYYGVFPALYAIRGTQYRDIATWIESLEKILSYPSIALLPGHTKALIGHQLIQEQVGHFKEAIEYVFFTTLDCMNQKMTMDETVQQVQLPDHLRKLPYLQEYYGTVEWAVKSIYNGYVVWFDGNATNLLPVSQKEYNQTLLELIGKDKLLEKVHHLMKEENYQLALQLLELCDDKELRRECLLQRAKQVTSANARHYYIASAKAIK